ncbi:MAG: sugar porter family MFS transporter [Gordonia sp. (in: high G+C Gram-positive bacteria)]|uniref:sugar porter family MFS transporter n=1 Tax=Gordonia sp. (in: high G+C Gram-positive bacteria) TaxID=84139 RepID=UPI0039E6D7BF
MSGAPAGGHGASTAEVQLPPLTKGPHSKRIGLISVVACLGGLLFGYDTGVSSGAEGPMSEELGFSDLQTGIVISSLVFAAAVGAFLGGKISDTIGRRKAIIVMAVMFFIGTLFVVFAPGFAVIVVGRIILGLAVGAASTVVPVYLAELAPFEIRGSITGRNEMAIVSGQFLAFCINAILNEALGHVDGIWRVMFAVCAVPAVFLFFGMLRMPESPRWLVEHGRLDEARAVLDTIRSKDRSKAELDQVIELTKDEEELEQGRPGLKQILTNKWLRRIVLVGTGVAVAQQLTGINAIMYYGPRVLEESGFDHGAALVAATAFGLAAVIGGVIALRNMDRLDRRTTFVIGLSLTTLCHLLVGIAGLTIPEDASYRPYVIAVLVFLFVLSMQSFLNIAVWVWLAEIFPLNVRGLAIGTAVFFGWFVNGLLALYIPTLVTALGLGTFFLFAAVGVIMLGFMWHEVPETRGRTLEGLEEDLLDGKIYEELPRRLPGAGLFYDRDRH